jgi:hypothetical protein
MLVIILVQKKPLPAKVIREPFMQELGLEE